VLTGHGRILVGMVRERLRRLRVGEREFVWTARIGHVPGERDCHRCIRLRVWGGGKNSRVLEADLLSKTWGLPWSACATDGAYPGSGDVRAVIDYALERGWDATATGGSFLLSERDHASAFELDDFLLTDRRRDPSAPDPTARVVRAYEQRTAEVDPARQGHREDVGPDAGG
jgi:hypothetical protein